MFGIIWAPLTMWWRCGVDGLRDSARGTDTENELDGERGVKGCGKYEVWRKVRSMFYDEGNESHTFLVGV